jgi:hypothetical protein
VTFDEYEQSILEAVACINATGATADAELKRQGTWYELSAKTTTEQGPAVQRCFAESALITNTWSIEIQPTEQELQIARKAMLQCLNENGLMLPDDITTERLQGLQQSRIYAECSDRVGEETGIPGG